MEKRGYIVLGLLVALIVLVIVIHAGLHITFYGTGIAGLGEKSISGLSIGPISGDTIKETLEQRFPNLSFLSKIFLIIEWLALVGVLLTIFILKKAGHHKEDTSIDESIRMKTISRGKSKTDIDVLYELLKEKKRLRIPSITKLFDVKEETALEWAKILESNNLVSVNYPRVGDPELVITEPK